VVIESKSLSSTERELRMIEKHVQSEFMVKLGGKETPAKVKDVLSHLSSSHIVHFACHGRQYMDEPLKSGLLLDDGVLKINDIMKESLQNASLAFLSACETAVGTEDLPDEAMHIAASLLFAGFHGVVGTMW
jgi:CHAT domain-containing protein